MTGSQPKRLDTLAHRLAAATLCLAACAAQAQPGELEADTAFKATIDDVRQRIWPEQTSGRATRGDKSLPSLLNRLSRIDNIDQLCEQGLGSARLCSSRSAAVIGGAGSPASDSFHQELNLRPFPTGLGTVIGAALRRTGALVQSRTKAHLTVADPTAYTSSLREQPPEARQALRSAISRWPASPMGPGMPAFSTTEQADMAGALLADYAGSLIDALAPGLDRCAPRDGPLQVWDKTWFSKPESAELSTCVAAVLGSDAAIRHLQGLGHILQLPSVWERRQLLKAPLSEELQSLPWWGLFLQQMRLKPVQARVTGYTRLVGELPLKVGGVACEEGNHYCALLGAGSSDADEHRCTLGPQRLPTAVCKESPGKVNEYLAKLNDPVGVWPGIFDLARTWQGKVPYGDAMRDFMELAGAAAAGHARAAQAPGSRLVLRLRQMVPDSAPSDSPVWVLDAISLVH